MTYLWTLTAQIVLGARLLCIYSIPNEIDLNVYCDPPCTECPAMLLTDYAPRKLPKSYTYWYMERTQ